MKLQDGWSYNLSITPEKREIFGVEAVEITEAEHTERVKNKQYAIKFNGKYYKPA